MSGRRLVAFTLYLIVVKRKSWRLGVGGKGGVPFTCPLATSMGISINGVKIMPLAGGSMCLNCYPFEGSWHKREVAATRLNCVGCHVVWVDIARPIL